MDIGLSDLIAEIRRNYERGENLRFSRFNGYYGHYFLGEAKAGALHAHVVSELDLENEKHVEIRLGDINALKRFYTSRGLESKLAELLQGTQDLVERAKEEFGAMKVLLYEPERIDLSDFLIDLKKDLDYIDKNSSSHDVQTRLRVSRRVVAVHYSLMDCAPENARKFIEEYKHVFMLT